MIIPSSFVDLPNWDVSAPVTQSGRVLTHQEIDELMKSLQQFKAQIPDEVVQIYNRDLQYSSVAKFENRFLARMEKPKHPYPDMVIAGYGDWWNGPKRTDFVEELIVGAESHLKEHQKPHDKVQAIAHINNLIKVNDWTALELRFEKGSEILAAKCPKVTSISRSNTPIKDLTYAEAKSENRVDEWFKWKSANWLPKFIANEKRFLANDPKINQQASLESRQDFVVWALNRGLLNRRAG
jgi:hypothetical protein